MIRRSVPVDRGLTHIAICMHCEFESFVVLQLIDIADKQNIYLIFSNKFFIRALIDSLRRSDCAVYRAGELTNKI